MTDAPIGVFDSGVGGISVLRELRHVLPNEDVVYVADQAYCPYGDRSPREIAGRARLVTDLLLWRGAKLVVVACNAATIAAIATLRSEYAVPLVGMEPAVKPAVAATRTGVVGVLATVLALDGQKFQELVARHSGPVRVITQGCPGLVEQVEAGDLAGPDTRALVERYAEPLVEAGADTLVLGCTHYPLIRPLIGAVVGSEVALVDSGDAVARQARAVLAERDLLARRERLGRIEWLSSAPGRADVIRRLWGDPELEVSPMGS